MYCKKCGCRLNKGNSKCPDCGVKVTEIEYCGGFWGLVGERGKNDGQADIDRSEKLMIPAKKESNTKIKQKFVLKVRILIFLLIVTAIICLVQTIRVLEISKRYDKLGEKYEILYENYKELYSDDKINEIGFMN